MNRILALPIQRTNARLVPGTHSMAFFVIQWPQPDSAKPPLTEWKSQGLVPTSTLYSKIDYYAEKATQKWEAMNNPEARDWKKWVYKQGNKLLDRIDADEWFLKEIPHPAFEMDIVLPAQISFESVEERFASLIEHRLAFHKRRIVTSVCCLPLSAAAGIMPGPNVFLAYNLFRVYSHYKASMGCLRLRDIQQRQNVSLTVDPWLTDLLERHPSLESLDLDAIQRHFQMPPYFQHEVRRVRLQDDWRRIKFEEQQRR